MMLARMIAGAYAPGDEKCSFTLAWKVKARLSKRVMSVMLFRDPDCLAHRTVKRHSIRGAISRFSFSFFFSPRRKRERRSRRLLGGGGRERRGKEQFSARILDRGDDRSGQSNSHNDSWNCADGAVK